MKIFILVMYNAQDLDGADGNAIGKRSRATATALGGRAERKNETRAMVKKGRDILRQAESAASFTPKHG
jgi:hypothetical protein